VNHVHIKNQGIFEAHPNFTARIPELADVQISNLELSEILAANFKTS